jgi:hypothetical protein
VAEEEDGWAAAAGGTEAEFENVAEGFLFVELDAGAEGVGEGGGEGDGIVDGGLVVGGGFDEDELAQCGEEPVLLGGGGGEE